MPSTSPTDRGGLGSGQDSRARARVHLVGADRPLLLTAIEHLLALGSSSEGMPSLESTVVVVPGRRAGRRLLHGLVRTATERGEAGLSPPRVITPGALPEALLRSEAIAASTVEARLARLRTLDEAPVELLSALGLAAADYGRRESRVALPLRQKLELASLLEELREQLTLAGLAETEAVERLAQRLDFEDEERWQAVAELARRCDLELERRGRVARAKARLALSYRGVRRAEVERVVLVGVAELAPLFRRCLERFGGEIEAMVAVGALQGAAARFDDLGCPRPGIWERAVPRLDAVELRVVDRPGDQIAEAVDCVGGWCEEGFAPGAISVGVTDEERAGPIELGLQLASLPYHSPAGRAFTDSRPARLLDGLGRYLGSESLEELAGLVRHVDLEAWLERRGPASDPEVALEAPGEGWASLVDRFRRTTLARRLEPDPGPAPGVAKALLGLDRALRSLVLGEPLGRPLEPLGRRSLREWCRTMADLLAEIYRGRLADEVGDSAGEDSRRETADALRLLGEALRLHHEAAEGAAVALWTFPEAVQLLLSELARERLQPEVSATEGVEILGWLELALDDAPALVVVGVNEGRLPERPVLDPFLNDRLRGVLGLTDGRQRLARDRYLLDVLTGGQRRVLLVAGRRGDDDEPLAPSRLLLGAATPERDAATLLDFYGDRSAARSGSLPWRHGERLRIAVPRPPAGARVPEPLRVTWFRDYLRCPYRFWLRHGLRLEAIGGTPVELDPRSFGTIGHEVLRRFSVGESARDADERRVGARLEEILYDEVARRVGTSPPPAARLQIAQLLRRLRAFGLWQARQVAAGWRIVEELSETDLETTLLVDGEELRVRGRVDRVEWHSHEGYRLLDYKTADRAVSPVSAHRRTGDGPFGGWIDLQLPLYRALLADRIEGPVALGYCHLSADLDAVPLSLAPWEEAEIEAALEVAREVGRRVRAGVFWPPERSNRRRPADGLEWICQDEVPPQRREEASR